MNPYHFSVEELYRNWTAVARMVVCTSWFSTLNKHRNRWVFSFQVGPRQFCGLPWLFWISRQISGKDLWVSDEACMDHCLRISDTLEDRLQGMARAANQLLDFEHHWWVWGETRPKNQGALVKKSSWQSDLFAEQRMISCGRLLECMDRCEAGRRGMGDVPWERRLAWRTKTKSSLWKDVAWEGNEWVEEQQKYEGIII